MKTFATSPATPTPMAPPFVCLYILLLNLKMWFFNTRRKLTPMAHDIILRISSSVVGFSSLSIHPGQRFLLHLLVPDNVIVGGLPFVDLVGQYLCRFRACSSVFVTVRARNSPNSLTSTFLYSWASSTINSMHLSTEKSTSMDGYKAATSMLPMIDISKSFDSLHDLMRLNRSEVLSKISGARLMSGLRNEDRKCDIR